MTGTSLSKLILLCLLLCTQYLFSQNDNFSSGQEVNKGDVLYERALSLQKNEALLRDYVESGILIKYQKAGYEVDTTAILETYRFYASPFDTSHTPHEQAIDKLQALIKQNEVRKEKHIDELSYELLKICDADLPEDYELFIENELLILTDEMLNCLSFEKQREEVLALFEAGIPQGFHDLKVMSDSLFEALSALHDAYQEDRSELTIPNAEIISSYTQMQEEISINQALKAKVPQRLYKEFRRCRVDFPSSYQAFLDEIGVIIDQKGAACFLQRIPSANRRNIQNAWADITKGSKEDNQSTKGIEYNSDEEVTASRDLQTTPPPPGVAAIGKGIFPTTALIDATAQFLVERTKEELILAFFDQFQKRIDEIPELRYLFSNTYSLLINREFFHIPTLGRSWKTAFERDLRDLPMSMERMINESPSFLFLKQRSDYRLFLLAFHFEDWYKLGPNPSMYILDRFVDIQELEGGTFMDSALAVVKHNLLDFREDASSPKSWYARSYNERLNKRGEELFIALQYQESPAYYENFYLGKGQNYASQMRAMPHQIFQMEQNILEELLKMDTQLTALKIPKRPTQDSLNREAQLVVFSNYLFEKEQKLRVAADALNTIQKLAYMLKYPADPEALLADKTYQGSSQLIFAASQLIPAIESREPSKIFVHSLQALQPIFQIASSKEELKMRKWNARIAKSRADTVLVNKLNGQISKSLKRQANMDASVKYLSFYGGFMLDIFYAKTAPEIKGLLYKYALPAGSYRIKRRSQISLELGAYPNLYVGREFIIQNQGMEDGWVAGVSAPVGLSVSWPIRKSQDPFESDTELKSLKAKKLQGSKYSGHAFSLFFPIIDIGAPFSYRWTNGNDVGFPDEIKWRQILAPGIYAVWGMKNKPISLSLGGQYVPKLRSITTNSTDISAFDTFRIGLNLAVDIPIFSLFRR
ncbi:MAG: hypothetical protein AAF696_10400 [Bacteroidota bacterium]